MSISDMSNGTMSIPSVSRGSSPSNVGEVKYFLKFAINVPTDDVSRMVSNGSRLLYPLKDCSRAGRVVWKLKLYRNEAQSDSPVAVYLKFEPITTTEDVHCKAEFVIRINGDAGKILERQSSSMRDFSRQDDCWGWSQFAKYSEITNCTYQIDGKSYLRFSGVIRIYDASTLLYPLRRHNFARAQNDADFRIKVGLATFNVHRAVLALHSDYFARLFSTDCMETQTGVIALKHERVQDVHLLLQFMYPGNSDILDEMTLGVLAQLASKYLVHTLIWDCLRFIDKRLNEKLNAATCMHYYIISYKHLNCQELATQCIRVASQLVWSRIKATPEFQTLDEIEKSDFLQKYLDFREMNNNNGMRTPRPTPQPIKVKPEI